MVFQNGALFDSLSVGENVGFLLYEHTKMSAPRIAVGTPLCVCTQKRLCCSEMGLTSMIIVRM